LRDSDRSLTGRHQRRSRHQLQSLCLNNKNQPQPKMLGSGGRIIRKDGESAHTYVGRKLGSYVAAALLTDKNLAAQSTATNCVCLRFTLQIGQLANSIPMGGKAIKSRLSWLESHRWPNGASRTACDKRRRRLNTRRAAVGRKHSKSQYEMS
jgi:hypothetical protein